MTWRRVAAAGWAAMLLATATLIAEQNPAPATGHVTGTVKRATDNTPVRVSGRIAAADKRELLSVAIVMTPIDDAGAPSAPPGDPSLLPDGRFSFGRVHPGRYQIRARGQTDAAGAMQFAQFAIDVLNSDIDGIEMVLRPGATIEGTVVVERHPGVGAAALSGLRVRAPSIDGNAFGDGFTGPVQANGTFVLRGVMQGPHQIVVDNLPPHWMLRQVIYRGLDVTDRVIDVDENEQVRGVRVMVREGASVVDGVVHDAAKQPVADAGVLIFARSPMFWMPTNRRMRAAATDREGRFSVTGLPAGDYLAVASMTIDAGDLGRRDRLRALEPLGTALQLDSDGARSTVTLVLAR